MLDQNDLQAIAEIVDRRAEQTEIMVRGEMQRMLLFHMYDDLRRDVTELKMRLKKREALN